MNKKTILNLINGIVEDIKRDYEEILDKVINVQYNLKLYDIATMDNLDDELFYEFCTIEYDYFQDYLKANNTKLQYIRNTSTFYLQDDDEHINKEDYYYLDVNCNNRKALYIIYLALQYEYGYDFNIFDIFEFDNDNKAIDINVNEIKYIIEEYKHYLIKEDFKTLIYNYIDNNLMNLLYVADYIINFKENQIENYNAFLTETIG